MFRTVKVLIACRDDKARGDLALHVEGLSFDASTVPDVRTALDIIEDFDILMLETDVTNGNAMVVLDRWVSTLKRPCLVMTRNIEADSRVLYMQAGAWNILQIPEDRQVLSTVLVRYGMYILEMRELKKLEAQVRKLTRLVTVFALLAAGMAGERVIELVKAGLSFIK